MRPRGGPVEIATFMTGNRKRNPEDWSVDGNLRRQVADILQARSQNELHGLVEFLASIPLKSSAGLLLELYQRDPKRCLAPVANLYGTEQTSFIPALWREFEQTTNPRAGWAILNAIANLELVRSFKGSVRKMAAVLATPTRPFVHRLRAAQFLVSRYRYTGKGLVPLTRQLRHLLAQCRGSAQRREVEELFEELNLGPLDGHAQGALSSGGTTSVTPGCTSASE